MSKQVGGNHYKSDYEHWDWAVDCDLGYLESAATKYVSRWKKKNGIQDLEKALSYLIKMKECFSEGRYDRHGSKTQKEYQIITSQFIKSNDLQGLEAEIMEEISQWKRLVNIHVAIGLCIRLLEKAIERQITASGTHTPSKGKKTATDPHMRPASGSGKVNHPAPFGYTDEES